MDRELWWATIHGVTESDAAADMLILNVSITCYRESIDDRFSKVMNLQIFCCCCCSKDMNNVLARHLDPVAKVLFSF